VVGVTVLSWSLAARAADRPFDMTYQSPPGCPGAGAFGELVSAKLAGTDLPAVPVRPRVLVALRPATAGFVAHLELSRSDGSRYVRDLEGPSCAELAEAMAFVLALGLGGQTPPDAEKTEEGPAKIGPVEKTRVVEPPMAAPETPPPAIFPEPSPRRWIFGIGAALGVRGGLGPTWTSVETGFAELRHEERRLLAPTFRAGISTTQPIERQDSFGTTDFSWIAGWAEGCPIRVTLVEPLQLLPCLGVHAGAIRAVGTPRVIPPGQGGGATKPWVDLAPELRLEGRAARWLGIGLAADLVVPLTTYSFGFDPRIPVYEVPRAALAGSGSVALLFP
jgi:hypothetical protein